ncbi:hypothetical protein MAHJHV65_43630 [Mycobacterium avium subsp. hominissuis]
MMQWLLWSQRVTNEDITSGRIADYLAGGGPPFVAKSVAGGGATVPGGHYFYPSQSSREMWPDESEGREGWRAWIQSPDGRLYPPMAPLVQALAPHLPRWGTAASAVGTVVEADCPRARAGHDFKLCVCGLRYIPSRCEFQRFVDHLRETAWLRPGWRVVEARGIAEGAVDYDVTGSDGFFWAALAWRRCERFRITELVA